MSTDTQRISQRMRTAANPHWWVAGLQAVTASCVLAERLATANGAIILLADQAAPLREDLRGDWRLASQLRLELGALGEALGLRLLREELEDLAGADAAQRAAIEVLITELAAMDQHARQPGRCVRARFACPPGAQESELRVQVSDACREFGMGQPEWTRVGEQLVVAVVIPDPDQARVLGSLGGTALVEPLHLTIQETACALEARERFPQAEEAVIADWAAGEARRDLWAVAWKFARDRSGHGDGIRLEVLLDRLAADPILAPLGQGLAQRLGGNETLEGWWGRHRVALDLSGCSPERVRVIQELIYEDATQHATADAIKVLVMDRGIWEGGEGSVIAERLARDGRKHRVALIICAVGESCGPQGRLAEHIGNVLLEQDGGTWALHGQGPAQDLGVWFTEDEAVEARNLVEKYR